MHENSRAKPVKNVFISNRIATDGLRHGLEIEEVTDWDDQRNEHYTRFTINYEKGKVTNYQTEIEFDGEVSYFIEADTENSIFRIDPDRVYQFP